MRNNKNSRYLERHADSFGTMYLCPEWVKTVMKLGIGSASVGVSGDEIFFFGSQSNISMVGSRNFSRPARTNSRNSRDDLRLGI